MLKKTRQNENVLTFLYTGPRMERLLCCPPDCPHACYPGTLPHPLIGFVTLVAQGPHPVDSPCT